MTLQQQDFSSTVIFFWLNLQDDSMLVPIHLPHIKSYTIRSKQIQSLHHVFFFYTISRYNELEKKMEGSPMPIKEQWPGVPTPVDAAVFYEGIPINLLFTHRSLFILCCTKSKRYPKMLCKNRMFRPAYAIILAKTQHHNRIRRLISSKHTVSGDFFFSK